MKFGKVRKLQNGFTAVLCDSVLRASALKSLPASVGITLYGLSSRAKSSSVLSVRQEPTLAIPADRNLPEFAQVKRNDLENLPILQPIKLLVDLASVRSIVRVYVEPTFVELNISRLALGLLGHC